MSDHDRTGQTLALLAQPGAYQVFHAMHARGGTATFAQITADTAKPLSLLRAMAAEGFVVSLRCGTLDIDPCAEAPFSLTARGEAVFGHLMRLNQWIAARPTTRRGCHPFA